MDAVKFQEAQQAYDAGDFRTAAKGFLAAAGRGTVGNGAAYHLAGNALLRLRRHADAITVYGHALRDEAYDRHGAVHANLGVAYKALGELSEALTSFEAALSDPGYTTPHKALLGMASVHMDRGRADEAAGAYRRAALDETNPDPGKSLVNMGLCLMALDRPADAVDAYQAALGFENYTGRGKALANLGQAYAALGEYGEAVKAFEKATQLYSHTLSPGAQKAYETSLGIAGPRRETVEGWVTGEMPPVTVPLGRPDGWDPESLAELSDPSSQSPPEGPAGLAEAGLDATEDTAGEAAAALGMGDETAVRDFFNLSEEEMKVRDQEARRAERGKYAQPGLMRSVLAGAMVALLLGGAVGMTYILGLGWPTQGSTVNGLFVAYANGEPVEQYWVAVPDTDVKKEMAKVPPVKEFDITEVQRGPGASEVTVKVTPVDGADIDYVVTLAREGVGWRISGLDYSWRSTDG